MKIIVTGGCGFIGSAVVRLAIQQGCEVVNVDNLSYSANPLAVAEAARAPGYAFVEVDICDADAMNAVFELHQPDAVMHLAAETHVDRSIDGPMAFMQTNVTGTAVLLQAARRHWDGLPSQRRDAFRFHHISTDEVFGALGEEGAFDEQTPYAPRSPYSASKASSDLLVRAWGDTYGLPFVLTNCSNNYGPWQFPEKLIPVVIFSALNQQPIPVYGVGSNVRDWLYVEDHAEALLLALRRGEVGQTYCIGGDAECSNLELVRRICGHLDELRPAGAPYARLIQFVQDRPGHDFRYAIDHSKITQELGWAPKAGLSEGLRRTIEWYLGEEGQRLGSGFSRQRLGLAAATGSNR